MTVPPIGGNLEVDTVFKDLIGLLPNLEHRRDYERDRLFEAATADIEGLLDASRISQRTLADRLGISEGRISQMLSGRRNLTLKSLADLAWALGCRFEIRLVAVDRAGTPAIDDPAPAPWEGDSFPFPVPKGERSEVRALQWDVAERYDEPAQDETAVLSFERLNRKSVAA